MQGTAHTFGDEINTDLITPSDYFGESFETMAEHVFEPIRPTFANEVEEGDIVVAGNHFGSGSSRETAAAALLIAGVAAVVAESFGRTFYRNSIAWGLPVVTCAGVSDLVSEGDQVEVALEDGVVTNVETGESLPSEKIPPEIRTIFDAGGLIEHYKQHPDGLRID